MFVNLPKGSNHQIPIKTLSEAQLKGKSKPSKEELERMYLKEQLNTVEIGKILNFGSSTIRRWLNLYKIRIRTYSETMLKGKQKKLPDALKKRIVASMMKKKKKKSA